jgi:hypothetical protein
MRPDQIETAGRAFRVAEPKRDTGSRTLMLGTSYGSYRGVIVRADFRAGELCREDRSCLFAPAHVAC